MAFNELPSPGVDICCEDASFGLLVVVCMDSVPACWDRGGILESGGVLMPSVTTQAELT